MTKASDSVDITSHALAGLCGRWLALLVLAVTGFSAKAATQQQLLDQLPLVWARAANAGDMSGLMTLYSKEAYIHVVFTRDELHGENEIRAYYTRYSQQPPKVTITRVDENSILNNSVGILSGYATVEFPGQQAMTTHFSIVGRWETDQWVVQLQSINRVE